MIKFDKIYFYIDLRHDLYKRFKVEFIALFDQSKVKKKIDQHLLYIPGYWNNLYAMGSLLQQC